MKEQNDATRNFDAKLCSSSLPICDFSTREEDGHYYARWPCGKAWCRVWVTTDSWGDWRIGELSIGGWYATNNVTKQSMRLVGIPSSRNDRTAYGRACDRVEWMLKVREALDVFDPVCLLEV